MLDPVMRLTGTPVLVLAALTPLMLDRAWTRSTHLQLEPGVAARHHLASSIVRRSTLLWLVVLIGALTYPASMLAGYRGQTLPGAPPHFPRASDCVEAPVEVMPVRVVLGYAASYAEAFKLRARGQRAGLGNARFEQDGCGRLRVFLEGASSMSPTEIVAAAKAAGLQATLELNRRRPA